MSPPPATQEQTMIVKLNAESNLGYAADQIDTRSTQTLGTLLEAVQAAVDEYGEDTAVVLFQTNNPYGANYGRLSTWELFSPADAEDDES